MHVSCQCRILLSKQPREGAISEWSASVYALSVGLWQRAALGTTPSERLKNFVESHTGLGPRGYAIIEQGMISRAIEAKPLIAFRRGTRFDDR